VTARHRPFNGEDLDRWLRILYQELDDLLRSGTKVLIHAEEVGDRITGIMGGYIRWSGLVEDGTRAIAVTERLVGRQLDPFGRSVVLRSHLLRD
jgi:hypothetical protein